MMVPVIDNWNIILIGAWNTRIFNVAWLSEFIFEGRNVNAAISLVGYPTKFVADGIELVPTEERLTIQATNTDEKTLINLEHTAKKILELLSHTPVRAVGVNITYRTDSPEPILLELFGELNDKARLAKNSLSWNRCSISRGFPVDKGTMNLILTQSQGKVDLQFNFHNDVENAEQARSYLESSLVSYKKKSLEIAKKIYNLELEEE